MSLRPGVVPAMIAALRPCARVRMVDWRDGTHVDGLFLAHVSGRSGAWTATGEARRGSDMLAVLRDFFIGHRVFSASDFVCTLPPRGADAIFLDMMLRSAGITCPACAAFLATNQPQPGHVPRCIGEMVASGRGQ